MTTEFDRIRIEGGDSSPTGNNVKVYRNGTLIPGLKSFTLSAAYEDMIILTTTQVVSLEEGEDLMDQAVQALEEREAVWLEDGPPAPGGTNAVRGGQYVRVQPDEIIP